LTEGDFTDSGDETGVGVFITRSFLQDEKQIIAKRRKKTENFIFIKTSPGYIFFPGKLYFVSSAGIPL